jgi:hypothetical protein
MKNGPISIILTETGLIKNGRTGINLTKKGPPACRTETAAGGLILYVYIYLQ